jgi:hypothetical protein
MYIFASNISLLKDIKELIIMKYIYCTVFLSIILISCNNNKRENETPVVADSAFEINEDTIMPRIEFSKSKIILPFSNSLSLTRKLKPDTLFTHNHIFEKYLCGNDYLPYIPFPDNADFSVIAVPLNCDGYSYRYKMLLVKDSIYDELLIESEIKEKKNRLNKKTTSFEISKDYTISITNADQKENSQFFEYKTYRISENGKFELIPEKVLPTKCLAKKSRVNFPVTSDDLAGLEYLNFSCNIDGMKNYACHNGVYYVTLDYKNENERYLILIYTECGDSSYADLIVVHNSRVISGLTIDSADYTDETDGEYSGFETTFEITDDLIIRLTHSEILKNETVSSITESYIINEDGKFLKQ